MGINSYDTLSSKLTREEARDSPAVVSTPSKSSTTAVPSQGHVPAGDIEFLPPPPNSKMVLLTNPPVVNMFYIQSICSRLVSSTIDKLVHTYLIIPFKTVTFRCIILLTTGSQYVMHQRFMPSTLYES